jgi:FtsP/CotA-like multicopper oxidase with cupredoxin domain
MVRIGPMASPESELDRRTLIAGLGAAALAPIWPATAHAQGRSSPAAVTSLALKAAPERLKWRPDGPGTPAWGLSGSDLSSRRGETAEIAVGNELQVPLALHWRGVDGANATEPLLARKPLAAGASETFRLAFRRAGTFLCDSGLLGDGLAQPLRSRPLIVLESETVPVDRDEVLLIEEWRLRPDGTAIAPGVDAKDTKPLYTLNGQTSFELSALGNQRLRLRFINASQRTVVAVKLENHEVPAMARWCWRPGAASTHSWTRRPPPRSCSMTARRPIRSEGSRSRATSSAARRCCRLRRFLPTGCRPSST